MFIAFSFGSYILMDHTVLLLAFSNWCYVLLWSMDSFVVCLQELESVVALPETFIFPGKLSISSSSLSPSSGSSSGSPFYFAIGGSQGSVRIWHYPSLRCVFNQPLTLSASSTSVAALNPLSASSSMSSSLTTTGLLVWLDTSALWERKEMK